MRKLGRGLGAGTFLALVAIAPAQDDLFHRALNTAQSAYAQAVKLGRPAAERMVREAPAQYRNVRTRVQAIAKRCVACANSPDVVERRTLLLELWRVRGSLDVLALLEPQMVHDLTGLDPVAFAKLRAGFERTFASLAPRLTGRA